MKKILLGVILISLSVLVLSCDKKCDCEYVISSYNYSTSEWEETSRYDKEGNCVDETILETTVYDTTSTIISESGEDTAYYIELISGCKEELDCVTWGGI